MRYLYELPKVVFNHNAYCLDRRLEELRGVRDPNDKIDLEVYEAEMERRHQRGIQLEADTERFRVDQLNVGGSRPQSANERKPRTSLQKAGSWPPKPIKWNNARLEHIARRAGNPVC